MFKLSLSVFLLTASAILASGALGQGVGEIKQPKLTLQQSGTTQLLISVSPVNSRVVWAAGTGGTYVVTTDGGNTWKAAVVPGAENLQFRDVFGVSDKVAYLMSIGNDTTDFRIYKTLNGGATWTIEFTNETENAFYDCFAFWTPNRGVTHSDSVNGVFPAIRTTDGITWQSIAANMPPALPGEASFAASGTCLATQGHANAWIATGGSAVARILATTDGGATWAIPSTGFWVGATWLPIPAPTWPLRTMAAEPGPLRTRRPCREQFSAWPMSAAFAMARIRKSARTMTILL